MRWDRHAIRKRSPRPADRAATADFAANGRGGTLTGGRAGVSLRHRPGRQARGWAGGPERSGRVHIELSTRHGSLTPDEQAYVHDKAEKLLKYFGRLMQIEVEVEHRKHDWLVEIFVSAEHKHDFV